MTTLSADNRTPKIVNCTFYNIFTCKRTMYLYMCVYMYIDVFIHTCVWYVYMYSMT